MESCNWHKHFKNLPSKCNGIHKGNPGNSPAAAPNPFHCQMLFPLLLCRHSQMRRSNRCFNWMKISIISSSSAFCVLLHLSKALFLAASSLHVWRVKRLSDSFSILSLCLESQKVEWQFHGEDRHVVTRIRLTAAPVSLPSKHGCRHCCFRRSCCLVFAF